MTTLSSIDQEEILKKFIQVFLPARGDKRKYPTNELGRITTTLNRVFSQQFGFNVTKEQVLKAFQELDYRVFSKKGEWNAAKKEVVPSTSGSLTTVSPIYQENDAAYLYIDIDSTTIKQFYLLTLVLPANTGVEKVAEKEQLVKRIAMFKQGLAAG